MNWLAEGQTRMHWKSTIEIFPILYDIKDSFWIFDSSMGTACNRLPPTMASFALTFAVPFSKYNTQCYRDSVKRRVAPDCAFFMLFLVRHLIVIANFMIWPHFWLLSGNEWACGAQQFLGSIYTFGQATVHLSVMETVTLLGGGHTASGDSLVEHFVSGCVWWGKCVGFLFT